MRIDEWAPHAVVTYLMADTNHSHGLYQDVRFTP